MHGMLYMYDIIILLQTEIVMLCFFTCACVEYQRKQDSTVLLQYQSVVIDINFVKYCITLYEAFTL